MAFSTNLMQGDQQASDAADGPPSQLAGGSCLLHTALGSPDATQRNRAFGRIENLPPIPSILARRMCSDTWLWPSRPVAGAGSCVSGGQPVPLTEISQAKMRICRDVINNLDVRSVARQLPSHPSQGFFGATAARKTQTFCTQEGTRDMAYAEANHCSLFSLPYLRPDPGAWPALEMVSTVRRS